MCRYVIKLLMSCLFMLTLISCGEVTKNPQSVFYRLSKTPIEFGVFSSDAKLATFVSQGVLTVTKADGSGILHQFEIGGSKVTGLAISQDSTLLAVSFEKFIVVWNLVSGAELGKFNMSGNSEFAKISHIALYAKPLKLLVGMTDGTLNLLDYENSLTKQVNYHDARISFLALGPHRQLIISAGHDGLVSLHDANTLASTYQYRMSKRVTSLAHNLQHNLLFVSDALNDQVLINPFASQVEITKLKYKERFRWFRAAAISPDGQYLATGSSKYWWTLWHTKNGQEIGAFAIKAASTTALILDMHIDKQNMLATLNSDGIVELWDINTLLKMNR
ncbi:WD40 repeat domain-containing protein [Pseudoalteromonas sp. Of7M-16]|uniref:WD40 repeat domain-containing protein n=1 Tax=Pseudoalteromonas sp. Of7M-16 TaxID=2917756 RepID=UPI001EF5ED11|nr:WD40 repeat domain-containing protein [Pseudoalteromonas sp. Of7M-16]MCG7548026.1 WD40 repeat domain-containing protein [Pseudoalteromonas sp. Of7M-16]